MPLRFRAPLLAALSAGTVLVHGCGQEPSGRSTPDAAPTDAPVEVDADDGGDDTSDTAPTWQGDPCAFPGAPTETHPLGEGWSLDIDLSDGSWSLVPPDFDRPTIIGSSICAQDGTRTVAAYSGAPWVLELTGGFRIELDDPRATVEWDSVATLPATIEREGEVVRLVYSGGAPALEFLPRGPDVEVRLVAPGASGGLLSLAVAPDEGFFGLGTQVTGMDLRGRRYPLWTQEQGNGKPEDPVAWPLQNFPEAAYAPMGVLHSSAGYAAVVTTDAWQEIDLAETDPERLFLRSHGALPGLVFVAGPTPRDRTEGVTAYTGRIPEPPVWVFAPWNDSFGGPERMWVIADTLRREGIPSSVIWAEDWLGEVDTPTGPRLSYEWRWSPDRYPGLPDDIARLDELGFAFLGYVNPFVPEAAADWPEGDAQGHFVLAPDGESYSGLDPRFQPSGMLDVTSAAARAWFGVRVAAAAEFGVSGWMADYAEWAPIAARYASGESPWLVHNRYPILWQQANRDAWEAARPAGPDGPGDYAYFVRSGWASANGGSAPFAPLLWGGDQLTTWDYEDGFPTVVPISAHSGMAGMPIFGSDIAGYTAVFNPPSTKELFFRWSALGAFHPLMRTHHGSAVCGNWSFDRDGETIAHYRRYARLHTLLLPLFRALLAEARERGLPLTRHPYLVEPDLPALWQGTQGYVTFLGDDILVAPVLDEGATERRLVLPGEGFWPLLGDAPVAGARGDTVTVPVPVTEIVALVRPGTIVPLLADAVDTFRDARQEGVTDLDDVRARYRLALYPSPAGELRATRFDGVTASGSGWPPSAASVDWDAATWRGEPIPTCAAEPVPPCADTSGAQVTGPGVLLVGDAELRIDGPEHVYTVRIAGAAWGDIAVPTPLTDLSPAAPPTCILPTTEDSP